MNSETRKWPLVEVTDPSMTRGLYTTWYQLDARTDRWFMVHAAHIEDAPVSVMAEGIKRERRFIGKEPDIAIMDAKGGAHTVDKERDETWFTRFRSLGLDYEPNDEPATFEEMDEWLRPVWDPVLEKAVPKLSICERVANMERGPLWALQRFQWDPMMTKRQLLEQPGKDWVDTIKYFVNQRSVNRARLRRDRERGKRLSQKRHQKLATSYAFGMARPKATARKHLWNLPSYR
jgi:hypothetical protein